MLIDNGTRDEVIKIQGIYTVQKGKEEDVEEDVENEGTGFDSHQTRLIRFKLHTASLLLGTNMEAYIVFRF